MTTEKTLTLEELKAKHRALGEEIAQKEKEEAEARAAECLATKATRKAELKEAAEHYQTLLRAYIKDYGSYRTTQSGDEIYDILHMFF